MSETEKEGPVPGGGPREGEEAKVAPNPNPDAVHPDYLQTMPGHNAPASDVEEGKTEKNSDDDD